MQQGYLYLETHRARPGLVRVAASRTKPDPDEPGEGVVLRYIARFADVEAARMHVHELLRHQLADVDNGLYRCSLVNAMSAIESEGLRHERVWIDHSLNESTLAQMADRSERLRERGRRLNEFWKMVGVAALILLGLNFLGVL